MSRRRAVGLVTALGLLVGLALVATGTTTRIWRATYPHLPPQAQAVPYRLRALVRGPSTPVALPKVEPVAPTTATAPPARVDVTPTTVPAPTPTLPPRAPAARLDNVRHAYQTWNNCGPATISMALSVLGLDEGQAKAAVRLKPNPDDKNVGPDELARYARERGAAATLRVGGRIEVLESLVAAGVPTIVETWFEPDPGDAMGHYRIVTGYDRTSRTFTLADSYEGPDVPATYDALDSDWRAFNRTYLAVFPPAREAEVIDLVGPDGAAMWVGAAAAAADEVERGPDAFGWFNLGTSMLAMGDAAGAADAFDRARAIGLPWRMLWYQFGPFEAYGALGRWSDVTALAAANLVNAPDLEESWYWLGRAHEAAGDVAGARQSWRRAVDLNPHYTAPQQALNGLETGAGADP